MLFAYRSVGSWKGMIILTKEKIKVAALKLFANNGYEGTSLENIAKEVGIRKASIYSHFESKEELFLTVFTDILNLDIDTLGKLSKKFRGYSPEKKLHSIFKYYCRVYNALSKRHEVVFIKRNMLFCPEVLREKVQYKIEAYENSLNKILISIFEEGFKDNTIRPLDIKDLLAIFYCIIDGLFVEGRYYARKEYASRFDSIWTMFWLSVANVKEQK